MIRISFAVLAACLMTGCATQKTLYSWGDYDQLLYSSYKDSAKIHDLRTGLETQITSAEQRQQKVPPGLYAELGTLYLQEGDSSKAVEFYNKEKNTWPESRGIMDALLKNLDRQKKTTAGGAQ